MLKALTEKRDLCHPFWWNVAYWHYVILIVSMSAVIKFYFNLPETNFFQGFFEGVMIGMAVIFYLRYRTE